MLLSKIFHQANNKDTSKDKGEGKKNISEKGGGSVRLQIFYDRLDQERLYAYNCIN